MFALNCLRGDLAEWSSTSRHPRAKSFCAPTVADALPVRAEIICARSEHLKTVSLYDAVGNLISDGTNTYTYNALNQLTSVSTPTSTTVYAYDALGNRISSTTNGQTTQNLVDPTGLGSATATVVGTFDSSGNLIAQYTYGLGLVSQTTAGGTYFYDFDALGSTADLTNASGSVVDSYAYNPFGSLLASSVTVSNPFTFVGPYGVSTDPGGLLHMGFRDFSPVTGQFASNDPLGLAGGDTNIRRYASADPVNLIDPAGMSSDELDGSGPRPTEPGLPMLTFDQVRPMLTAEELDPTVPPNPAPPTNGLDLSSAGPQGTLPANPPAPTKSMPPSLLDDVISGAGQEPVLPISPPPITCDSCGSGSGLGTSGLTPSLDGAPIGVVFAIGDTIAASPVGGAINKALYHALTGLMKLLFALDPNNLIGPAGFGPQGFIPASQPLDYTIDFQNEPTATAPAQQVVVTQQLSPSLDWSTFQLGDIDFGNITVQVPPDRTSYQTVVDASASTGVLVDVSANFNPLTGVVTWTFTSLDPTTLDTPSNPLEGFLPPDKTDPEGDGYVSYSVEPKASDTTGTVINAQASVVFDTNAPLATPAVINTIDAGPPSSSVNSLPPSTTSTTFAVTITGTDESNGSGIASFALYVSTNGAPFTLYQGGIPAQAGTGGSFNASTTFTGVVGDRYAFFSVATDNVGNVQPMPAAVQATTQIVAIPPPVTVTSVSFATIDVKLGKGKRARTKAERVLDVQFSGALTGAGNLGAYQLLAGKTRKHVTKFKNPVPLSSATFNPSTFTVMLAPKKPFNLSEPEQLRITAADLTDSFGRSLDGNDDGKPGANFVATLSKSGIRIAQAEVQTRSLSLSPSAVDVLLDSEHGFRATKAAHSLADAPG
jgi:RHS repeat-associated protein